jgi:hypothetical protein
MGHNNYDNNPKEIPKARHEEDYRNHDTILCSNADLATQKSVLRACPKLASSPNPHPSLK